MRGYELAAFQVAHDSGFFMLIPVEGKTSLEELAKQASKDRTERIIRILITYHFFAERRPGFVSTAPYPLLPSMKRCSLAVDGALRFDEMVKAAVETSGALRAHPAKYGSIHLPFFAKHRASISQYYAKYPEQAGWVANAMAGWRWLVDRKDALCVLYTAYTASHDVYSVTNDSEQWRTASQSWKLQLPLGQTATAASRTLAWAVAMWLAMIIAQKVDGKNDLSVPPPEIRGPGGPEALTDGVRDRISFKEANTQLGLGDDIVLPEPGTVPRSWEREMCQAGMVIMVSFGAELHTKAKFEALLQ
ncbi:Sterigmatocystin 8-O-methyltransferase [Apiospora phragmitis]|uniref:Sterigmatocystin 8-O-methyltransferase n=1 Tax=Apiospora phragmitis TaxID=2905665 RepID=A0ABR1V0G4_9PEZI